MSDLRPYGRTMTDFITPYRDSLEQKMSGVLGVAEHDLPRFRPESPLGNFASDVLREVGSKIYKRKMDIGLMNVGGLRNDLYAGDIRLGDIYRVFPFENTLAILELKGSDVEDLIHQMEGKRMEALSGVTATLNIEKKKDENNQEYEISYVTDIRVGGAPIDPERTYYIATIDYLAEGNDGLLALTKASKNTNTGILLRDLMVEYVRKMNNEGKKIDSSIDGRITVKEIK